MNIVLNSGEPILGFNGDYRWLSNFVPVPIEFDGVVYPSVEHAYVAAKCNDINDRYPILNMTAGQAKRYGRQIVVSELFTDTYKVSVMNAFLRQKFTTQPYMSLLIGTQGRYIEETNTWGDTFWGVCDGVGKNTLGCLIMQIRDELVDLSDYA